MQPSRQFTVPLWHGEWEHPAFSILFCVTLGHPLKRQNFLSKAFDGQGAGCDHRDSSVASGLFAFEGVPGLWVLVRSGFRSQNTEEFTGRDILAEKQTTLPESSKRCHLSLRLTVQGESAPKATRSIRTQKGRSDPSVEEASSEADEAFEVINGVTHLSHASAAKPPRAT